MSTASPLPLPPLQNDPRSENETRVLKQQVTHRLHEHRQKRARVAESHPVLPMEGLTLSPRRSRVADSVAARFAKSVSYREFLQLEAAAAVAQASAVAEVARRNAEAVASAHQELLQQIEQWDISVEAPALHVAQETGNREQGTGNETEGEISEVIEATGFDLVENTGQPETAPTRAVSIFEELRAQAAPMEPAVAIPANLIEFPRQLVAARRARPRHAEGPLREEAGARPEQAQLRIFEVEANSVSTTPTVESVLPEWHDIRLDAPGETQYLPENFHAQLSPTLPLYVAPLELRAMATVVDGCCVAAAFLLAVGVAAYSSPVLPTGLLAVISGACALFGFAMLYLLLFFTLDDATPGMRYARIGFCTFGDENPSRASIRRRIFALLLAALPLGLGLIWAWMDEDGLGWHDRISRMYPRAY